MNLRRAIAGVVVGVSLVGFGLAQRRDLHVPISSFTNLGAPTLPFVPAGSFITSSWFCPGVPAGAQGLGGVVVVTNPSDQPKHGQITVYSSDPTATAVVRPVDVAARTSASIDLATLQTTGAYVSAVVEIEGGGGFVEQHAVHPAGDSVSPCANAASSNWYFADGFTASDSVEQIVLTNPYPEAAIVDIGFVTNAGVRNPSRLQGFPVPGRSVQVIELGAKDEPVIATKVVASRGRVVAARAQHYLGSGRLGFGLSLGAPALADQYFFADGESGTGISELYQVYNPTSQDVTVDARFLGVPASDSFANDTQIDVAAGRVVTLDVATVKGLPAGRHAAVFSTFSTASIVVERVINRPAGKSVATPVVMGMPGGLASARWSAAIGTDEPIEAGLVVLNADSVATTVEVATLGPGGFVPVPGLEAVPLAAGGVVTVPLTDPSLLKAPLIITSKQRLFVERLLGRGGDLRGRTGSFALSG